MEYEIEFCVGCYLEAAVEVAKTLLQSNSHAENFSVKLKASGAGEFKISRENQTLYRKDKEKSLPPIKNLVAELEKFVGFSPASDSGHPCSC
jgi:predicted Rdx family selenoprotein